MASQNDADLVHLTLNGQNDSFAGLVTKYQNTVFNLAYQKSQNRAEAEDIAQEVFLRAYQDLRKLRKPGLFGRWLYGIALNVSRERARVQKPEALLEAIVASEAPSDDAAQERLLRLVGELPDKYRLPLTLYFVDGLSHRQIGERLGMAEPTARSRVHRAKAMIREMSEKI